MLLQAVGVSWVADGEWRLALVTAVACSWDLGPGKAYRGIDIDQEH